MMASLVFRLDILQNNLNDTEFGFYFINYHSKEPTIYADLNDDFLTALMLRIRLAGVVVLVGFANCQLWILATSGLEQLEVIM